MKKITLSAALLASLLMTGCNDELKLTPYNAVTVDQAFSNPTDFANAVNGMYAGFLRDSYYGGVNTADMIILPDLLADNVIISQRGRLTNRIFNEYTYSGESTWGLFFDAYVPIRRANAVLENLNALTDAALKDNYRGEALAVRALCHFDLVRVYGKGYTQSSDQDLGVPYITSTDANQKPARNTVKQVYDMVVADLVEAEKVINEKNGTGRLNKAAVNGLLSRAYLYRGEWQKAVDAATKSLTASPNIATIADLPGVYKDATEAGVLFKILIVDKDRINIGVNYSQASTSGIRSEYVVDYDLYQQFTATDIRKTAGITTSNFNSTPYNHIAKYLGRATGNANVVDAKVLRSAEVLLNRAEALFNLGKEADALADLNRLRTNRYAGFDATKATETGTALGAAIDLQRRLELAFEGHRFFDLKRKGLPVVRNTKFGDLSDGTGVSYTKPGLPAGDPKFQLPIPQAEINANPNVKQNPGY